MSDQPISYTAVTALIIAIFVGIFLLVLYLVYFLNLDSANDFGAQWTYKTVSSSTGTISPVGHHVYASDASQRNGTNNGNLYLNIPKGVPYVGRIFIIYNTADVNSQANTLYVAPGDATISGVNTTPLQIAPATGTLFIWSNSTNIIPLVTGSTPLP
jgi:hypothetical protein